MELVMMQTASVTLMIGLDAFETVPDTTNPTLDVTDHLIELLREHCGLIDVVEQDPERLIVQLTLTGTFKEIQP
jgi:hypothetical protein